MSDLEAIQGIGPVLSEKFFAAGIRSVASLLEQGATREGRDVIATRTGIAEIKVLRLVNHADLMRIEGIGGEYSELLEAIGADTVAELSRRSAANLVQKMKVVSVQQRRGRALPTESQVAVWIEQARKLPRVIQH